MTRLGSLLAAACVAAATLMPAVAQAQETGTALKPDEIKAEPFTDAKTVGRIAKGDRVEIVTRQSGWLQIKAGGKAGWVRLLSIRRGQAAQTNVAQEVGSVAGIATGRTGSGQVVSTTGVRGLSAEELKQAKFDEKQIAKAESLSVPSDEARRFAGQVGLATQNVKFLPDPRGGSR